MYRAIPVLARMMGTMALRRAFANWHEVDNDDERKPDSGSDQATERGNWAGAGPCDNRSDVRVGFLRESGEGRLRSGGLRRGDQLLHQEQPLPGGLEVGYWFDGKPCAHRSSHAGGDRDLCRDSAHHRSAYSSGRICGFSVSWRSLDYGVGYVVDLGTAGSRGGIAWALCWRRRPEMGR